MSVSLGDELKDGYKPTDAWIANGIGWLDDVAGFYRERAVLEREYSSKLSALSAKYLDKKAKLSTSLSVGDTPQITPGSLENASLVMWTEVLNQTEAISRDHKRLANEFSAQVGDQLTGNMTRFEELRSKYSHFHKKLIEDRDSWYNELKKAKATYDTACQAMESQRSKASRGSSSDGKIAKREDTMNNSKNAYLISINVANRIKDKYYHEDVPELLDNMQELNEARVRVLNSLLQQAVSVEDTALKKSQNALAAISQIVSQNEPHLDSAMFAKHNVISGWKDPADFLYEPSPVWHEDESMSTEHDAQLQDLRNRLAHAIAKAESQEKVSQDIVASTKTQLNRKDAIVKEATNITLTKGDYYTVLSKIVPLLEDLTASETKRIVYEVEIETIEIGTQDKDLSRFAAQNIITKSRFGGLIKKDVVEVAKPRGSSRTGGSRSKATSVVSSLLGHNRTGSRTNGSAVATGGTGNDSARALYDYDPIGEGEISMTAGNELSILEPDDGSGWVVVQNMATGESGMVPGSYIEIFMKPIARVGSATSSASSGTNAKKKGPAVAPKRGAKKVSYVIALYDYDAQTDDELTIRAGDKIAVLSGDQGGWTQGELNGMSGSFPTSYAK